MRYLLLLLPLVVVGCADTESSRYGYNEGSPAYAPGYASSQEYSQTPYNRTYSRNSYNQTYAENCGTPDYPRACPRMPRHPLPYYPDDR